MTREHFQKSRTRLLARRTNQPMRQSPNNREDQIMRIVNLVGRQVAKLRYERDLTQDHPADQLQRADWLNPRSGVSKIEGGSVYAPDFRLFDVAIVGSQEQRD